MYDSVTAADIPLGVQMVAGYDDGLYAWSDADWQRFPNAVHVHIATQPGNDTSPVMDCERGDWSPSQIPGGCATRRQQGIVPTAYSTWSDWDAIKYACQMASIDPPLWWLAAYDYVPVIPDAAIAKQYVNPPQSGGHYDLSVVRDHWPGIDPNQTPTVSSEDRGDAVQLTEVGFTTDAQGNGWIETQIPWSSFLGISHRGAYPPSDGYWPGEVGAQDRDGNVLLQFTRGLPRHAEVVMILHNP